MGTKLEFAVNPLENPAKSNSFTVNVQHCMDDFRTKGVTLQKQSCENSIDASRMLERETHKYNKETIKRTIQIHESVFKQQVRELHRLYSVQRMLMDEFRKTNISFQFQALKDDDKIEDQFRAGTSSHQMNSEQDSEVELTLSIGSTKKRAKRELHSSPSFKSDNTTLDEETKRRHWIFQGMRINR